MNILVQENNFSGVEDAFIYTVYILIINTHFWKLTASISYNPIIFQPHSSSIFPRNKQTFISFK